MQRTQRSVRYLIVLFLFSWWLCASYAESITVPANTGRSLTLLADGHVLATGGLDRDGNAVTDAYLIDSSGNGQKLSTGLIYARQGHTATLLPDGTVLIFGGTDGRGHYLRSMEIYHPTTKEFTEWSGPPLVPRAFHTATLLTDGRIVIIGGTEEGGAFPDDIQFWNFRNGDIQSLQVAPITPRQGHSAKLLSDGTILIEGGYNSEGAPVKKSEIFNPAISQFLAVRNQPDSQSSLFVTASLPADGATAYPIQDFLKIRFSELIDVRTANEQTISLATSDGTTVSASVIAAEQGRLAFLIPDGALTPGTDYLLTLNGVTDLHGNPIPTTIIHFHTQDDIDDGSGDGWIPGVDALNGNWSSGGGLSKWQKLPPLHAASGATAVAGQVLGLSGKPLAHVTLQIGNNHVQSDNTGRFLLRSVLPGRQVLTIDGRTADTSRATYGLYEVTVEVKASVTNVLNYTIWMTRLDTSHATHISSPTTAADTVITTPLLPGLELHLPKGTVIVDHEGKTVTELSITPIPLDKPPFPLPTGVRVPIYFTIQPGGSEIEVRSSGSGVIGARLYYPNTYKEPPGTIYNFWNYDPTSKGWYIYGNGRVSQDWQHIVPDPGVAVYELTGAMVGGDSAKNPVGAPGTTTGGEPVDLSTGQFVQSWTDISLPDIIPIRLVRTYTTNDHYQRAFGIGTTDNYDMFMVGDTNPYTYQELIEPSGSAIRFNRTSSGTSWGDAVYTSSSFQGPWYGATIYWNTSTIPGASWILKTRNGMMYGFPEASGQNDQVHQALVGIEDRYGDEVLLTRDNNANLVKITSPSGRYISFTRDALGRISQAIDNGGRTVSYTYDSGGRLATATDVNGGVTTFVYNSNDQVTSITDARNITYLKNEYDSNGRVIKQTLADGGTYLFQWTPSGNAAQQWVTSGLPVNRYDSSEYEGYTGLISQVQLTDPRGYVRVVSFNNLGMETSDTRSLGQPEQQVTSYQYYADNLPESVTDPLGRVTTLDYDPFGNTTRLTWLTGTNNAVTYSAAYDPVFSNLLTFTDPLNHTTTFSYNPQGELTQTNDPLGHGISLAYASGSQPSSVTDAMGNSTSFTYYAGKLTSITDALGNKSVFFPDALGRTITATDPLGNVTQYQYDNAGHLTGIVNPQSEQASLTYDANGDLSSAQDFQSHKTQFTYDGMDRPVTRTDPLGRISSATYDLEGDLVSFTDPKGQVTSRSFDSLGRLSFAGYGTTNGGSGPSYQSTISYQYDGGNRMTSATDSVGGAISRTYDGLDNLTNETTPQGSISYTYDAAGRRSTSQASGGALTQYSYDAANRLTGIMQGTAQVGFSYDAANHRTTLQLPNGVKVQYGYDQDSHPQSITYTTSAGAAIGNLLYVYDANSRPVEVDGSLAQTNLPSPLGQATYDAANQLLSWDGTAVSYDANGNMISDVSGNQYAWNARNQLVGISGSMTASFAYDGFGRRTQKAIGPQTTSYEYDGVNRISELSNGVAATLLPGALDEYFQRSDSSGVAVPLTNALGSVIGVTDASDSLATTYWYDPYGGTTTSGAVNGNSTQFSGRENDGNGLYYYRARYYNPYTGRFLSEDPLGLSEGPNLYAYANDNPILFTDPSGKDAISGFITGAIYGGIGAYGTSGGNGWVTLAGAIGGGIAGGVAGALLPPSPLSGAAGGAAGDLAGQELANWFGDKSLSDVNGGEVAGAALGGATGGLLGQWLGDLGASAGLGGPAGEWGSDIPGGAAGLVGGVLGGIPGGDSDNPPCQR